MACASKSQHPISLRLVHCVSAAKTYSKKWQNFCQPLETCVAQGAIRSSFRPWGRRRDSSGAFLLRGATWRPLVISESFRVVSSEKRDFLSLRASDQCKSDCCPCLKMQICNRRARLLTPTSHCSCPHRPSLPLQTQMPIYFLTSKKVFLCVNCFSSALFYYLDSLSY